MIPLVILSAAKDLLVTLSEKQILRPCGPQNDTGRGMAL